MAHDDQFTATGPAFTGSGFTRAGFSTNRAGADFTHGVNAEGSTCGVFGKSVQQGGSSREADVEGVGVFGKGDNFGVFGQGNLGMSGVIGTHNNIHRPNRDGAGVIGAVIRGGIGVMGVSLNSLTALVGKKKIPHSANGNGVGVFGASGSGAGVRGTSDEGSGGEFVSNAGSGVSGDSDSGTGVSGNSRSGVGVEGRSMKAAGLHGVSSENRGAVFESGENVAQMRLVPQKQRTRDARLPKWGKVGDLILIRYRGGIQPNDTAPTDLCSLWLCVPTSKRARGKSSNDSNLWQEVMLGQVIAGTV